MKTNIKSQFNSQFNGNILIYGLGIGGMGALNFCSRIGIACYAHDDNATKMAQLSQNSKYNLATFALPNGKIDYILCSPGIDPNKNSNLANLVLQGAKIITDIELAKIFNPDKIFVGITGTNGKSTTTTLTSFLLNEIGFKNNLCGNIGICPLDFCGEDGTSQNHFVVEVSSYQASMLNFTFNYTAFLNITPDHAERHGGFEGYFNAKANFVFASQVANIINFDDKKVLSRKNKKSILFSTECILSQGLSIVKDNIYYNGKNIETLSNIRLAGPHNMQNIACSLGLIFKMEEDFNLKTNPTQLANLIAAFAPLQHRIEFVCEKNGVKYYNDSKATNVQSCEVAVKSFTNIVLLVGGVKKEQGIEYFFDKPFFYENVKQVICYGGCGEEFYNLLAKNGKMKAVLATNGLKEAVQLAKNNAANGNIILLSPCCASFDEFKNFEERGNAFKKFVME